MKKTIILTIFTAVLVICSSCGMDVEQQAATNENELVVAEQTVQGELESEDTTKKLMEPEDAASEDSTIYTTESSSGLTNVPAETITANKSSKSTADPIQRETTGKSEISGNMQNTETQNPATTQNGTHEAETTTDMTSISRAATESYEQKRRAEYDAVVENAISDQPYNDVLKSTVSDDIILWHLDYTLNPWMSNVDTPVSMNNRYKIELIRKIDDQRMYSIQKPESGGLFYSFYVNSGLECTAYITKSLYLTDYNAIKVGSSIDDVIAIEPATQAYINRNRTYDNLSNDGETSGDFEQHIILKDGLLKLTYSRSGDTYKVSKIDFFDNFKESVDYGMGYPCVYDYSILPEDYPV